MLNADGPEFVLRVLNAVADFAAFTADNDQSDEHDFGCVEVDGHAIFWKLDDFQKAPDHSARAETPENAETIDRVLTVIRAGDPDSTTPLQTRCGIDFFATCSSPLR